MKHNRAKNATPFVHKSIPAFSRCWPVVQNASSLPLLLLLAGLHHFFVVASCAIFAENSSRGPNKTCEIEQYRTWSFSQKNDATYALSVNTRSDCVHTYDSCWQREEEGEVRSYSLSVSLSRPTHDPSGAQTPSQRPMCESVGQNVLF